MTASGQWTAVCNRSHSVPTRKEAIKRGGFSFRWHTMKKVLDSLAPNLLECYIFFSQTGRNSCESISGFSKVWLILADRWIFFPQSKAFFPPQRFTLGRRRWECIKTLIWGAWVGAWLLFKPDKSTDYVKGGNKIIEWFVCCETLSLGDVWWGPVSKKVTEFVYYWIQFFYKQMRKQLSDWGLRIALVANLGTRLDHIAYWHQLVLSRYLRHPVSTRYVTHRPIDRTPG